MKLEDLEDGSERRIRWILASAVIVTILLVWVVFTRGRRGPAPPGPVPDRVVSLVAPRGDLVSAPESFAWQPVAGAVRYTIRISDADAVWPLFVRSAEVPGLALAEKEAAALLPGRFHVWEVEAYDARGELLAAGNTRFRVLRPDSAPAP